MLLSSYWHICSSHVHILHCSGGNVCKVYIVIHLLSISIDNKNNLYKWKITCFNDRHFFKDITDTAIWWFKKSICHQSADMFHLWSGRLCFDQRYKNVTCVVNKEVLERPLVDKLCNVITCNLGYEGCFSHVILFI